MDTARVLLDQTVLVERGRITAIGPASEVEAPTDAVRIDGHGRYLMPGLADMHAHVDVDAGWLERESVSGSPDSVVERRLFQLLSEGITTIRDVDYVRKGNGALDDITALLDGSAMLPYVHGRRRGSSGVRGSTSRVNGDRITISSPTGPNSFLMHRRQG